MPARELPERGVGIMLDIVEVLYQVNRGGEVDAGGSKVEVGGNRMEAGGVKSKPLHASRASVAGRSRAPLNRYPVNRSVDLECVARRQPRPPPTGRCRARGPGRRPSARAAGRAKCLRGSISLQLSRKKLVATRRCLSVRGDGYLNTNLPVYSIAATVAAFRMPTVSWSCSLCH